MGCVGPQAFLISAWELSRSRLPPHGGSHSLDSPEQAMGNN